MMVFRNEVKSYGVVRNKYYYYLLLLHAQSNKDKFPN